MTTLLWLMAVGTVALNVALVGAFIALLSPAWCKKVVAFTHSYGRIAIFFLSVAAVVGTLLMQYVGGLEPCLFCWWQRIFMYPLPIILSIAILKNTDLSDIADYVLGLSICGALVALYQHLLQVLPSGTIIPCDAAGDCAVRSVFEFNYVTIPWMALSIFTVFIFIALVARKRA